MESRELGDVENGFEDRYEAGRRLAEVLDGLDLHDPLVVGLPRGGVPVADEVARSLGADLDICLVRKLGAPEQPEFGIGAIGEGGALVLDSDSVSRLGITKGEVERVIEREREELGRQAGIFRDGKQPAPVKGRDVVVVDDGVATGVTARAAGEVLMKRGARRVFGAFPVGSSDTVEKLEAGAFDRVICLLVPGSFGGVGVWYRDFRPVPDEEVVRLLGRTRDDAEPLTEGERDVLIPTFDGHLLPGTLSIPERAKGIVVFVHGSGSSRLSPRNLQVAEALGSAGFATLLFDLLTGPEGIERTGVFDIGFLTRRLLDSLTWLRGETEVSTLPVGLFGASTGAAAAIRAASLLGSEQVFAVVSRGGRPDLAGDALAHLEPPTLLVVGGNDPQVLELNRAALRAIPGRVSLEVVPGASHLFEEPGALEQVHRTATRWFEDTLAEYLAPESVEAEST